MAEPNTKVWWDQSITYSERGEQRQISVADVLVAAARMLRDGKSLKHIRTELDLADFVSDRVIERAIVNVGMPELERRIASGQESAETRILIDKEDLPLHPDEED